jgi:tRNA G37 N-methylase Trm5
VLCFLLLRRRSLSGQQREEAALFTVIGKMRSLKYSRASSLLFTMDLNVVWFSPRLRLSHESSGGTG